jgi:peptidoglycan hydrolase-like protein with peptidoglycan-binding domain
MTPALDITGTARRRRPVLYSALACALVLLAAIITLGVLAVSSSAKLSDGNAGLVVLHSPFGGAKVVSLEAYIGSGHEGRAVRVQIEHGQVFPVGHVRAGEKITVVAVFRRPGWLSWLTGKTEQLHTTVMTPSTRLLTPYLTVADKLKPGAQAPVRFSEPISYYRVNGRLSGSSSILRRSAAVPVQGEAGTDQIQFAARSWERPTSASVAWFPAGSHASAVAMPAPGTKIGPVTPLTLTFSKPVGKVLHGHMPLVQPATAGAWRTINSRSIQFVPSGYGYGLGASVSVGLPAGIHVIGGVDPPPNPTVISTDPATPGANWTVPAGSTLRLQQLLAELGYLPVSFHYAGASADTTLTSEEAAAVQVPAGKFSWRYPHTPAALKALWKPGVYGELTKGAVMAFENYEDQSITADDMAIDGVDGPTVWKALIAAVLSHHKYTFGYSFVSVSENTPEMEHTWHNGKIVVSGLVNTGIPAAPTQTGTFAVFEHVPSTTMSGLNPNGTKYSDPGILWVSYFNGGDALHEFVRASYGFPQSLGCVEQPDAEAAKVYPYTPIGTIVQVNP